MTTAHFNLTYDGPALESHQFAARDLAPALLAVSDTLEAANTALNGDRVKVAVNVRASFITGSFGIDFSVIQQLMSQLVHLFSSDGVTAAANLIALLGFGGATGTSLIWLLKKLRGRPVKKVVELKDGRFRIIVGDESYEVEAELLALLRNYELRKALEGVTKPLAEDGIDKVALQRDSSSEPEVIHKDERGWFVAPSPDEELLEEREDICHLQLVNVAFKDENKWRFSDGGSTFYAAVLDEDFLRRMNLDEVSFAKNDVLQVRLRTRQFIDTTGNMRSDKEVIEVLDKRSAARQLRLPISHSPDDD